MDYLIQKKVHTFFAGYRRKFFKKGEILIYAGDAPTGIFFVEKGLVKQYAVTQTGEEVVLNIFKENSFFPISLIINLVENQYYYEAMTDVLTLKAPKIAVSNYLSKNPDVLYDLLSRVYRGLDGILTKLTHLMAGSAYTLLLVELISCTQRFSKHKQEVVLTILQEDLADQTGLARETVSRSLHLLQEKGLIELQKGKIIVVDLELLKEELADAF